jgi:hypothetical protein
MNFFKLITWYPNMVQIKWKYIIQYTFNFHKDKKSFKFLLKYIFVSKYTCTLHFFSKNTLISHFIKRNEFFFPNILPRFYILT